MERCAHISTSCEEDAQHRDTTLARCVKNGRDTRSEADLQIGAFGLYTVSARNYVLDELRLDLVVLIVRNTFAHKHTPQARPQSELLLNKS